MDFKVRVAHLLTIYLEKAEEVTDIGKIIDTLVEVHAQALAEENQPLLLKAQGLFKLAIKRGAKDPLLLVALTSNLAKLTKQLLKAMKNRPQQARQVVRVLGSIVRGLERCDEQEKGEFITLQKKTVKSVLIHSFQGHLPLLDLQLLKDVLVIFSPEILMQGIKTLAKMILPSSMEGSRTEHQRIKAIMLFEFRITSILRKDSEVDLTNLFSLVARTAK